MAARAVVCCRSPTDGLARLSAAQRIRQLAASREVQLLVAVAKVRLDGLAAGEELLRDLAVRAPGRGQLRTPNPRSPMRILDRFQFGLQWLVVTETAQFEELLRASDLRVTRPRLAVLDAVYAHPHADTASIIGFVREDEAGVSHQTVYNALNALTVAGLLRQIQPPGSVPRYESRVADNHHHLVCRVCGAIEDVECAVGDAPCLAASEDHGYAVDEAEVVYWGTCPECADSASPTNS